MSTIYSKYKEALLADLASNTIKVALIDTASYTFSDSHQYYSSISSAVVGTPQTLSSKSVTNGIFDAGDATFTALTGNAFEALIIYKDTGNSATSPLIAYIDSFTVNGSASSSFTPNGGDVVISWDNTTNKIFKL